MIDHEENVAAIIVEPIVGTNGVLVPPPEYLPKLAELSQEARRAPHRRRGDDAAGAAPASGSPSTTGA